MKKFLNIKTNFSYSCWNKLELIKKNFKKIKQIKSHKNIKKKKIKNKRKKMTNNPIKEDETQLIGIDFNDFGNNSSNENVNSSKDDPIIKEISVL